MGGASRAQSSDTDCSVLERTHCLQGFVLHLPGLRTIKLEHPGEQGKSYLGASASSPQLPLQILLAASACCRHLLMKQHWL